MSDLVVIVYPSEEKAEEVRKKLFELQTEYLIKLGDAVIATKSADGQIKLHQTINTTAAGAVSGSSGVADWCAVPQSASRRGLGRGGGALGGALTDVGINDNFMKQLAESIKPGDAALFVLIQSMTADKVIAQIKDYGGVRAATSLDETKELALRNALASHAAATARRRPSAAPRPETPRGGGTSDRTKDCHNFQQGGAAAFLIKGERRATSLDDFKASDLVAAATKRSGSDIGRSLAPGGRSVVFRAAEGLGRFEAVGFAPGVANDGAAADFVFRQSANP